MNKVYTVQVNDVPALYPVGYFPRKFKYKEDAIACAKDAVKHGATMARVEFPDMGKLDFRPEVKKDTL